MEEECSEYSTQHSVDMLFFGFHGISNLAFSSACRQCKELDEFLLSALSGLSDNNLPQKIRPSYCWWLKSCTTWDVWNPINNGINYQPQLVIPPDFWLPSTVANLLKSAVFFLGDPPLGATAKLENARQDGIVRSMVRDREKWVDGFDFFLRRATWVHNFARNLWGFIYPP